jgi:hypothetical protein
MSLNYTKLSEIEYAIKYGVIAHCKRLLAEQLDMEEWQKKALENRIYELTNGK